MAQGFNTISVDKSIVGAMFIGGRIGNTTIKSNVISNAPNSKSTANLQPGQISNSVFGAVFAGVNMENVVVDSNVNTSERKVPSWDTVVPDGNGLYNHNRGNRCSLSEFEPVTRSSGESYKMDSYPYKGAAFILNNSYFPGEKLPERKGSDVDIKNAKDLWKQFGFYVKTAENKSAEEIFEEITDFLTLDKVTKTDCIVVMLMSHGGEGVLHGNDKTEVKYTDLFSLFQPDNCPKLKDKPKLFFIQACRGKQIEVGVDAKQVPPSGSCSPPIQDHDADDASRPSPFENCLKTPLPADFYVAHSTCDGFYSLRNNIEGSYFIQALCEVFYPLAAEEDLNSLMTKVSEKVSCVSEAVEVGGQTRKIMQQPQTHSTLRKKVYFKKN